MKRVDPATPARRTEIADSQGIQAGDHNIQFNFQFGGEQPTRPIPEAEAAVTPAAAQSASDRPPRAEVSAIPLSPAVLSALETARAACKAADRQFFTIDVLLALLNLPGSKVAEAFDQVRPGLARDQRDYLVACQVRAGQDGRHPYQEVNVERRAEVRRARELVWQAGGRDEVTELDVLLGILDNDSNSGTRRDLERRLGVVGYSSLRQAAERMLEAADTPSSNFGESDDGC